MRLVVNNLVARLLLLWFIRLQRKKIVNGGSLIQWNERNLEKEIGRIVVNKGNKVFCRHNPGC